MTNDALMHGMSGCVQRTEQGLELPTWDGGSISVFLQEAWHGTHLNRYSIATTTNLYGSKRKRYRAKRTVQRGQRGAPNTSLYPSRGIYTRAILCSNETACLATVCYRKEKKRMTVNS